MIRRVFGMLALFAAPVMARAELPSIPVMVLGAYHFGNPGLDVVNAKAEDVTTPARQHELAALADALATFRPTKVMVEAETAGPDFDYAAYHSFKPADLAAKRSESVQIGFRVAHQLGLTRVEGIDETGDVGNVDYYPFDKVQDWAKAHHREADLAAIFDQVKASVAEFETRQKRESIPSLLGFFNSPSYIAEDSRAYTAMLRFGDDHDQPGAALNGMWMMRNAKIFAKLAQAARPGDRVLVIYGAGHGYWLRQLAATTPGFRLEEVEPYLAKAVKRLGR